MRTSTTDLAALGAGPSFSLAEVAKHNTPEDCWIAVAGGVYDATKYLEAHPGGAQSITMIAGTDATEDFEAIHSKKAWADLESFRVGSLVSGGAVPREVATAESKVALVPGKKLMLKLVLRDRLSDDSFRLRFALPSPEHVLGLPVGKHVFIYGGAPRGNVPRRASRGPPRRALSVPHQARTPAARPWRAPTRRRRPTR